jgi:hypothetical protein
MPFVNNPATQTKKQYVNLIVVNLKVEKYSTTCIAQSKNGGAILTNKSGTYVIYTPEVNTGPA